MLNCFDASDGKAFANNRDLRGMIRLRWNACRPPTQSTQANAPPCPAGGASCYRATNNHLPVNQARLAETMPREIGALQQALASSITASTVAFGTMLDITDKLMGATPAATCSTPPDPENDPLNLALAAYEKAEKLRR